MRKANLTDKLLRSLKAPEKTTEIYDTVVSSFGIRLQPGGSKAFFIAYWSKEVDNARKFTIGKFPAMPLTEARKVARDCFADIQKGIDPLHEKRKKQAENAKEADNITFDTLCDLFIDMHVSKLRKGTQADYTSRINLHIRPVLKNKKVEQFSRRDARNLLFPYVDNGQGVHANRIHAVLSKMLNFAVDAGYIAVNPIIGMQKMGTEKSRQRHYTESEIQALWQAFATEAEPIHYFLKVLFLTGQRRGETAKMKWNDIDFSTGVWTIPAENTKNKKEHFIPLPPLAIELIEKLKPLNSDHDYVFNSLIKANTPINAHSKITKRISKVSGVNSFRIHDIRRTVATLLAKEGTPRHVLKKILNHTEGERADITSVYDRYDYLDEKRQALMGLERSIQLITTGETAPAKVYKIS